MRASSLLCQVRSELRKLLLDPVCWALPVVAVAVGWAAAAAAGDHRAGLAPARAALDTYRAFAAGAAGVVALGLPARLVAIEYELGTIRVVLARGVGRLRLLAAKLAAAAVVTLPFLASLALAGAAFLASRQAGVAWSDVWPAAATVALSAVVCAVLGAAAGAVGRSMTFALAVAAGFFPLDNGLGSLLPIIESATQERVWGDVSTYLLGPTLNHLPSVLAGRPAAELVTPMIGVDAAHGLAVVAGYAVVLTAAAALATWGRDTRE
jgi:hypothetical protein